jgi:hypothetical protein
MTSRAGRGRIGDAPLGQPLALRSAKSHGIDAPSADVKAGKVRQTVRSNGEVFDWQELLESVFHVLSSDEEPKDASVVVPYRGSYCYIADNDLETKAAFVLLTQLIAPHSATASSGPAMSFSFGRQAHFGYCHDPGFYREFSKTGDCFANDTIDCSIFQK